ncbi:MAG TPA: aromatic ring-hydroxylating dioxygenase subunit alpha [Flavisolibacter sp.]|nr:aromatic ring-hydroxylating dioxygenase subunit alpha [Flavisolibacter sp.]
MSGFNIDPDISKAKTISTDFYTDPSYFAASKDKIFARSWQFIGDEHRVQTPGSCYPLLLLPDYLSEPLLLTRNKGGRLNCVSNVCTHRGNLLITEPCTSASIRCKYHGRMFDLDGRIISMPEFKEVKNFPSIEDNLHQLPLYQWGPLLFTSLDGEIAGNKFFNEMEHRLSWLPLHEFVFSAELTKTFQVNAHWALYCENYLEGFHIPFVHSGLNAVIDYGSYTTELFAHSNLQLGIAKDEEDCFDLPPSSPDFGKRVAAYYFWVFPNLMFNFYPWGLSVNIVQPVAIDHTEVIFLAYIWKKEKYNRGAGSELDKVELEDEAVVQNVQKGIRSRFYNHGRYSVTREQGTHHFHRLIAQFMN